MNAAAVYVRISDDRQGLALGVQRQLDDCESLAERHGWEVVDRYVDNDVSAYSGRVRPEYTRLCDDMKAGRIDTVVAWHNDRLHRSPRELEDFIDLIEATGATVATVTAGDFDLATPEGRLTARITVSVAMKESEDKSRRARRKQEELAKAGKVGGGGTRPFGFEDDRVTIREDEAELIREAVARIIAGETIYGIGTDWGQRGIETPTGKTQWRSSTLKRMLRSPRIAGLRQHQGEVVGEAVWEAIISPADRLRVIAELDNPSRTPGPPRSYLLTGGIAVCGRDGCGVGLVARPRADRKRQYVCAKSNDHDGCGRLSSLAEPLEGWVLRQVTSVLASDELWETLRRQRHRLDDRQLVEDLADAERRLEELARMYAEGETTKAEWLAQRGTLTARIQQGRRRLTSVRRQSALDGLEGAAVDWEDVPFSRTRAIVETLVDRVTVNPAVKGRNFFDSGRVDVTWKV